MDNVGDLKKIVSQTMAEIHSGKLFKEQLPDVGPEPFSMIAMGKCAGVMAKEVVDCFSGQLQSGLVVTQFATGGLGSKVEEMEGDHPHPSKRSLAAGKKLLEFLELRPAQEKIIFLISGGASALCEVLEDGVSMADLTRSNQEWVRGGLSISQINENRKKISQIKGGKLKNFLGIRETLSFILSDVPKNPISTVGSGIIDFGGSKNKTVLIGSPKHSAQVAAKIATGFGYHSYVLSHDIDKDHLSVAKMISETILETLNNETMIQRPCCMIWSGETSVSVPVSGGRGGRNQQLTMEVAASLKKRAVENTRFAFASIATDGKDGNSDWAGGYVSNSDLVHVDFMQECLSRFDSAKYFEMKDQVLRFEVNSTNLADLMIALIL